MPLTRVSVGMPVPLTVIPIDMLVVVPLFKSTLLLPELTSQLRVSLETATAQSTALLPPVGSYTTFGLFIIGRMWSPLCLVKLSPLRFLLQSEVSTKLLRESTRTGVAVLLFGPLLLVDICITVLGM